MDAASAGGMTLETRFEALDRPVLLSGVQALVRVLLEQARLDRDGGLRTGGFVSGYRGSPLGGLDQELWREAKRLSAAGIRFEPGINEDLAATMLWGTQQLATFPDPKVEGVFGVWYGKGPGVDRSADALRCANIFGTTRHGGVLAVSGDDHAAHSSTFPHQTDQILAGVMIPVLAPADVGDIIDLGLAGIALSRYAGVWAGLKTIAEVAEQSASIVVPGARAFAVPAHDFGAPLNFDPTLEWPRQRAELERRLVECRIPAVGAFARANGLDRLVQGAADAPLGIVTVGKAHHDAMHALGRAGLADDPRIAVYKVGLAWPLETEGLRRFAAGRRALLVVEEKRGFVEPQVRDALYNMPADRRPAVAGRTDFAGAPLLPSVMELSPGLVAHALLRVMRDAGLDAPADPPARVAPASEPGLLARAPTFCAGCPHATSTVLPEGSFAMAGIGCHIMALERGPADDKPTRNMSQMGGEGVAWAGIAPFSGTTHLFANMGDGTFQHSGLLAIRQAVATGVNITYKILFNDAVAMTGGQPAEGGPSASSIARQVAAEGITRIALVADDAARLPPAELLPPGTTRDVREDLDRVQRELRATPGVSVLIYDQVCATEKRRRRKRGKMSAADIVVRIDERVCENCGDCTAQSHCIAVEPVETEYGRKRRISPTACNTDLSCLKGFCPSFVTIPAGAAPARTDRAAEWAAIERAATLTDPAPAALDTPWRGLFAGIGGAGIVTAGAILAMAAHLEGHRVTTLDFTGLAQKNGAVVSHVQVARAEAPPLDVVRIPRGEGRTLIAADLAVAAGGDVLGRCAPDAAVFGNLDLQANAAFLNERDLRIDPALHRRTIERATGGGAYLRAGAIAECVFGTAQVLNTVLLGMAWQAGALPVGEGALLRAIELNGTAVPMNLRAFRWGRMLAADPALAARVLADPARPADTRPLVDRRADELIRYQGERLAARYRRLVEAAQAASPGAFAEAVAESYFRVLAYKDEYEVARLHTLADRPPEASFHMAPPLITRRDPATGRRRKIAVPGRVALPLFRLLRHGKALRGTSFDPFGWQEDRRMEREMIAAYEADMARAIPAARAGRVAEATALARLPTDVRGFGPIKLAAWRDLAPRRAALLAALDAGPVSVAAE